MSTVEEALLHLQRLILKARQTSHGRSSDCDGNGDSESSTTSERVSVEEIERRFTRLEAELFRQEGLQQRAIELHRRGKQRRRQQEHHPKEEKQDEREKEMDRSDCVGANAMALSKCYKRPHSIPSGDAMSPHVRNPAAAGVSMGTSNPSGELHRRSSVSLSSTASILQRSSTREATPFTERRTKAETSTPPHDTHAPLSTSDTGAHVVVDLTDGSTQLRGIIIGSDNENSNGMTLKSGGPRVGEETMSSERRYCCFSTPSYSFAQVYANDDRRRLLFVIDQLSHVLREERSQKEALQCRVIPVMVQHIESLEREVALQQREMDALKREVALQVELSCMAESTTDEDSEGNKDDNSYHQSDGGGMKKRRAREGHVVDLLLECERHLRRLVHKNTHHR